MNKLFNEDLFETTNRNELQNKIDLIITSPPYNTSRVGASDKYSSRYDMFEDYKSDDEYIDWTIKVFNALDTVLKENGSILYNISYSSENAHLIWLVIADIIRKTKFTTADCIIWKKHTALPNNVSKNKLTRIIEYVFVFVRKSEFKTFNANKKTTGKFRKTGQPNYENIYNFFEAKNNNGSTELNKATFSSDFVCRLLDIYAKPNSLIYDPFMGTGSTAVGCLKRDMMYVGSEISTQQCSFAEQRIQKQLNNTPIAQTKWF